LAFLITQLSFKAERSYELFKKTAEGEVLGSISTISLDKAMSMYYVFIF